MTAEQPSRPVLRYHGGKYLLAPWIISHFPVHLIYTEVFGGAASVLLSKPRAKSEIYNDLDGELVSLFRVLRDPSQARELHRLLDLTPYSRCEFESAYHHSADPIESARRHIVRSFMGIGTNSVSRPGTGTPSTGFRSALEPNGDLRAAGWARYPSSLGEYTSRLRGVLIEHLPAIECLLRYDRADALHYVDPPYPKSTRKDGGDDYRHEMTDADHRELAECLHALKGAVVLSGYACDLYDVELFSDWSRFQRKAFADKGQERTEVLWLNGAAANKLEQKAVNQSLF